MIAGHARVDWLTFTKRRFVETSQSPVVIVTGASSGIGEAASRRLFGYGFRVVLAARRAERLQSLRAELEQEMQIANRAADPSRVLTVIADITKREDRERLVNEAKRVFGRIDGLVNNAGFGQRGPIELVPVESIRQNFETNLFSLIALTQLVIPIMREQGKGRIVNVGSVAGRIARPFSSVYDATKHALEAVTDGLRGEMSPFGIRVSLIQPGFILTEFLDVANNISRPVIEHAGPYAPYLSGFAGMSEKARRIAGHPDDIAQLVVRALTDERPRFRYPAPLHAKLFLMMKRFFPERLFEEVVLRQLRLKGGRRES
jgi:short-subunit dehydrogenase